VKFLLDTCVISELAKTSPDDNVFSWVKSCPEEQLFLSVLTIGELQKGISKLQSGKKRLALQLWVDEELTARFAARLIPIDFSVAQKWGEMQAKAEKQGLPIPAIDGLIAASGLAYNLTVVTRNVQDMAPSGVQLINPWE
jgi:hypothetical protein